MVTAITSKMKIYKPAEMVFEAFVNPEKMSNFWFSSGSDRLEQGMTITWKYEEYNAMVDITVLEMEENKKLVYAWGEGENETVVSILLKELSFDTTIVEVTESGFKSDEPNLIDKLLGQKEGWVYMLTSLKAYLENGIKTLRASLVH